MAERKDTQVLSRGRRAAFTLLTGLLPVLFLLALEGGLRLAGYGDSLPLFTPVEVAPRYRALSRDVARRYFADLQRVPTGLHDAFLAEKDSAGIRVFVQGGSSAAGFPYYYGGSFSRMLEQRLAQTHPERRVEVVNTAVAAVSSYTLLDQVPEILAQEPDAIVIYAGHNEFYGALGAGSAESLGRRRQVVNLYLRLRPLRVMQLLRAGLGRAAALSTAGSAAEVDGTLMARMVREQTIPYGSPLYDAGLRQFRGNLRAILDRYGHAGVPVFVGTLASNERTHAPFAHALAPDTDPDRWQRRYDAAQAAATRGALAQAAQALKEVTAMDSTAALGYFALGVVLDSLGRHQEARRAYVRAKDRDNLRFRASEDINTIIREEVAQAGATLVETRARLAAAARDGIIGSDLMLEHLHPNLEGYFLLADAFYEALLAYPVVPGTAQYLPAAVARQEVLYTAVDSLFGALRVRRLMSVWPFEPPGTVPPPDTTRPGSAEEAIARAYFSGELRWYQATDSLRVLYMSRGDVHGALRATLAMVQQFPYLPEPYALAADLMLQQRRLREALTYYEAANDLEPTALVHFMMGMVHLSFGRMPQAVAQLEQAAAMEPRNTGYLLQLAQSYFVAGRMAEADTTVRRLLAERPDHRQGLRLHQAIRERNH